VALLACAPAALASVTQTVNFQSPTITEEEFVVVTDQYAGEGLAFISPPSQGPVEHPGGSGDEPFAQADLEREGGTQLITGYEHEGIDGPGECVKAWSDLAGRLTKQEDGEFSEKIAVKVGAGSSIFDKSGGGKIILDAYSGHGEFLLDAEATLKPNETKVLEVKEPAGEIAYFYVIAPDGGSCKSTPVINLYEVSFTVPSALPQELVLEPKPEPGEAGPAGSLGGTAKLPISVFRENGADNEIELHVSGLPQGVTVKGGAKIPAGKSSTTLELAISEEAATGETPLTIGATSSGLTTTPAPIHTNLDVSTPLQVYLNSKTSLTTNITPCGASGAGVTVGFGPGVGGNATLSASASGDTSGLSYSLAKTTVASGSSEPVGLALSEPASSGTGTADITIKAKDAGFRESEATLVVNRETGKITTVSSPGGQDPFGRLPEAPQLSSGGSEVRIEGSGLCPGSTVQFGNEQASATPSEFGPGGDSLVVSIPRLATSGTVTVASPAGKIESPHSFTVDNFRNEWGWAWENGKTPKYLSYALIESIFGREESTSWLDSEWPSIDARLFKGYASGLLEEGSCLGMVSYIQYLSQYSKDPEGLDPIEGGLPRSGEDPYSFATGPVPPGENAAKEPSAQLEELISIFHFDQFSAQFIEFEFEEHEASHPPLYVVEQLKRSLAESGEYGNLNFDFLTMQNEGSEGGGHAVVPYGLEGDGQGGYYIDVYNPNRPYYSFESTPNGAAHKREVEESRIHVAANGEWTFLDGFGERWHGDEESLVFVPWGKLPVPVAVPIPELSGHAERPEIPSLETGLKLLATWIGISSSGSNSSITQVTDSSGHTLVAANGTPNRSAATRIHHGQLHFSLTGTHGASPSAWLPAGSNYTVTESAKHDGPYSATVLGNHLDALVSTTAATGTSDKIGVSSSTHSFSFAAGSTKPVTLSLAAAAGKGSSHTAQLETTSPAGSTQTLGFKGNTLVYAHTGPAVTIDLQLSSVSGSKAPVALNTGPIRLAAGQHASIAPTAWGTLGAARITISGHGSKRTIVVHNKSALKPPLHKLSLAVHGHSGLTRSLTIAGRLGAVPAGAQLQYAWKVTDKGRVVAHHELTLSGASLHRRDQREAYDFTAPANGKYQFTGTVSLLVTNGLIEQGSASSRSVSVVIAPT
jgi:hypothetical protein